MTAIADDFAGIAARLKQVASPLAPKIEAKPKAGVEACAEVCPKCEGGGWMDVFSHNPPSFGVCDECGNPESLPCP